MTWSVTETCLSEQGLLGQHWIQLAQHVRCVTLESIPVKLSCQPAQISACSEPLVHSGREPGNTLVGRMPKRPGTLRSEAESPLRCVYTLLEKKELKQVSTSSTSSCEHLFRSGRWVQHGAKPMRNSFGAAPRVISDCAFSGHVAKLEEVLEKVNSQPAEPESH